MLVSRDQPTFEAPPLGSAKNSADLYLDPTVGLQAADVGFYGTGTLLFGASLFRTARQTPGTL